MENTGLYYGKEAKAELKKLAEEVLHEMQDEFLNDLSVPALMDGNQLVAIHLSELQGAKKFLEELFKKLLPEEEEENNG